MTIIVFLALLTAAGLGGFATLRAAGFCDAEAWAAGRVVGLVLVVLPAWWWGSAGLPGWRLAGAGFLVVAAVAGLTSIFKRPVEWREVLTIEAVFWIVFVILIVMRLPHPEITGTEKPMDFGIMMTLLRSEAFPPSDMWLAHEFLPYYYWGALLWTVPMSLSLISGPVAYNLIVALVGAMIAALAWVLGQRLSDGRWTAGLLSAFFVLFAGTPDGLRQLLSGIDPRFISLWDSSREVVHTITEFPLFTLWLGDLHPHLLSIPLVLGALLLALHIGRSEGIRVVPLGLAAVLFGVAWAANPWAMPPTLALIGMAVLSGDGQWHWPVRGDVWRWAVLFLIPVLGWLVTLPFHLAFHPPFDGIGLVRTWTPPHHLALFAGCLFVPVISVSLKLLARTSYQVTSRGRGGRVPGGVSDPRSAESYSTVRRARRGEKTPLGAAHRRPQQEPGEKCGLGGEAEGDRQGSLMRVLSVAALAVLLAVVTGHITLVLLAAVLLSLLLSVMARTEERYRPALGIAAVGVFLFLAPELVFVRDSYGDELHRMNTVFKAYIQGWIVLALVVPALIDRAFSSIKAQRIAILLIVAAALPHTFAAFSPVLADQDRGLDGLCWMSEGDRSLVDALLNQPAQTTLIEATGGAYSSFGRLSSASGVPSLLGWANHELVWRGSDIVPETMRRENVIRKIYTSADPVVIRRLVTGEEIDLVAIGDLELLEFTTEGLDALRSAGKVEFENGNHALIRFDRSVDHD